MSEQDPVERAFEEWWAREGRAWSQAGSVQDVFRAGFAACAKEVREKLPDYPKWAEPGRPYFKGFEHGASRTIDTVRELLSRLDAGKGTKP